MISTSSAETQHPVATHDDPVCNIAHYLPRMAATSPDRSAVIVTESLDRSGRATYRSLSFVELESLSNRYANALRSVGIDRGTRTLVMVRPGVDFVGIIFALFKIGAVPVMIDPGMGPARLLDCVRQVDLEAFIGIPLAHAMRTLKPGAFRGVRTVITVGRRWFWGGPTLDRLAGDVSDRFDLAPTRSNETAAILFTSGSTGPAKGVVYEHGMFDAQVRLIRDFYGIQPGEVDLPAFPLFVLFSTAMGMTAVIPDMDPSHPARVNPANIVRAIRDHHVTSTFGSPAIWSRVAAYCARQGITLPSLRRILIAGAPVPRSVIEQLHRTLSADADIHTPYGATESLPLASISGRELLAKGQELHGYGKNEPTPHRHPRSNTTPSEPRAQATGQLEASEPVIPGNESNNPQLPSPKHFSCSSAGFTSFRDTSNGEKPRGLEPAARNTKKGNALTERTRQGAGTCVGRVFPEIELRFIRISDEPIENWSDDLSIPDGEIGELVVAGPVVTNEYFGLPHATAHAKIRDGDRIWHRMGDVGYRDTDGRIWFCGRKSHRVQTADGTLFTECCEPIFNEHPEVNRSALVGAGKAGAQIPVLVVELNIARLPRKREAARLRDELRALGTRVKTTSSIEHILFHRGLPVDVRHNAKIHRERLSVWAAGILR